MQREMKCIGSGCCQQHGSAASVAGSGNLNELQLQLKHARQTALSDNALLSRQPLHLSDAHEVFGIKAAAVTCTC